ncbi:MAG: C39 family peptidase [Kiloniellales bacterium]
MIGGIAERLAGGWLAASLLLVVPFGSPAGGEIMISNFAGGSFGVPVVSMKERRWATVVRQQYDYSCGSAAVATLLTYHYGEQTSEGEVFDEMYRAGDQEKVRERGFSMLDMKHYMEAQGYRVDGFRAELDVIEEIGVPIITLISIRGYRHFVVIKGIENGEVLVGDPALGLKTFSKDAFAKGWSGVALAIRSHAKTGRTAFNQEEDKKYKRPLAPVGQALLRDTLSSFTLMLPGRGEFF